MNSIERAKKIKLLILDVDGVLTDGRIIYDSKGNDLKFFDVYDGMGLHLLHKAGIKTILISARASKTIKHRAKDMDIAEIFQNADKKIDTYKKILEKYRLKDENICFVGDDLVDLAILKRAGFSAAVVNACEEVKKAAHYITHKKGGRGAVREVCEFILKNQNKWPDLVKYYA